MIPLNLTAIIKALQKKGFDAKTQTETNQAYFIYKQDKREFPVFIRIHPSGKLLQILAFVCNFNPEKQNDVARMLHLFNRELDMPGFGMDEAGRLVFYRCMQPIQNNEIDSLHFDCYLMATQSACKLFGQTIAAVATGVTSLDELLKKAKNLPKS